jgi:hypothetical protein
MSLGSSRGEPNADADASTSARASAGRRYRGRHRHGTDGLIHCRMLMAMAAALRSRKEGWRPLRHDVESVRRRLAQDTVPARTLSAAPARLEAPAQARLAA